MNKNIFLTLTAVLITGAVLYKMPSRAGGDAGTKSFVSVPEVRARMLRRSSGDWRRSSQAKNDEPLLSRRNSTEGASRFGGTGGYLSALSQERALSSNIEHFQQKVIERRSQLATERAAKVRELLEPVMAPENITFLTPIVLLLGHIISFLNQDYIELLKQINDEREWANTLYSVSTMYQKNTDKKIAQLEQRIAELKAASEPTEY